MVSYLVGGAGLAQVGQRDQGSFDGRDLLYLDISKQAGGDNREGE